LPRGIPDFEFDDAGGEVAFLGQEGGADGGFFVGVEVVVDEAEDEGGLGGQDVSRGLGCGQLEMGGGRTLPTAASPRRTSLTLLLGLGAEACVESAMLVDGEEGEGGRLARKLRPML